MPQIKSKQIGRSRRALGKAADRPPFFQYRNIFLGQTYLSNKLCANTYISPVVGQQWECEGHDGADDEHGVEGCEHGEYVAEGLLEVDVAGAQDQDRGEVTQQAQTTHQGQQHPLQPGSVFLRSLERGAAKVKRS